MELLDNDRRRHGQRRYGDDRCRFGCIERAFALVHRFESNIDMWDAAQLFANFVGNDPSKLRALDVALMSDRGRIDGYLEDAAVVLDFVDKKIWDGA